VAIVKANNNTVGGADPAAGNLIAFNGGDGVRVDTGTGNLIRLNSVFANAGLGIDLVNGANHNQPTPVLTSAASGGGSTVVQGTLQATPAATFTVDFYGNADGRGQGEQYLGSLTVTTNAAGQATFRATVAGEVPSGGP
jgi:titin